MQIILLKKVLNLGNPSDLVNVKAGYARNFLLPQGKAMMATRSNLEYVRANHARIEEELAENTFVARERAKNISALKSVVIMAKAGDRGKLFGSIGTRDIAEAITSAGIEVKKNEVFLPKGVLRTIGEHEVVLKLYENISARINVSVATG